MNDDTVNLLKECNAGCKYATNSTEQIYSFVHDESLKKIIDDYNGKHIKIGDRCHVLLNEIGKDEKDPKLMAKAFAQISTEFKLMADNSNAKIASILIDGCNMGIKSVSEFINRYKNASKESVSLAKEIVKAEQDFSKELLAFL